jgi:hypothetical protein
VPHQSALALLPGSEGSRPDDDWPSCGPARSPREPRELRPARPCCPAPAREASRCSVVVVPVPYADREHRPARRLTIEAAVTP